MSKRDPEGVHYEARAREILSSASSSGWSQAEVFVKIAEVSSCEMGPLGLRLNAESAESGLAVRVWRKDGRSGFIHTDAVLERRADDLVSRVEPVNARASRSLIPRLPSKEIERGHETVEENGVAEQIQDLARAIVSGFSARGYETVALLRGRIASGRIETIILNSLGARVRSVQSIAWVDLLVIGGANGGDEPSLLRYQAATDDIGRLDPSTMVEESSWRAAACSGGQPAPSGSASVLLEPRASAQWIRSLVPGLRTPVLDRRVPMSLIDGFRPGEELDVARQRPGLVPGLNIIDEPGESRIVQRALFPPPRTVFDGEGRPARRRDYVRDGVLVGRCIDSQDAEAPEEDLGPMRRDSYRDPPEPAPLNLVLAPGAMSREQLLERMGRGLFVTSLSPWSRPGSQRILAEVRGLWMEPGSAPRPVRPTLLALPALDEISRIVAWGSDLEFDRAGLPVGCPSVLLESVDLAPL